MIYHHLFAVTLAFFLDLLIGDPPSWPHPVKWIGTMISKLDRAFNKGAYKKRKGLFMLIIVLSAVLLITVLSVYLAYLIHPLAGILWEAVVISTTIAQKGLRQAGMDVCLPLNERDFPEARVKLSYIVGRDTADLDEPEIVRGTVETVAENTSDGITAPLFWAAIGGAPLAMVYRAINTCDSMVGYKNDKYGQFGWASAKLDDIVNWIPSRLTGFLMLLCSKSAYHGFGARWKILFKDAKNIQARIAGGVKQALLPFWESSLVAGICTKELFPTVRGWEFRLFDWKQNIYHKRLPSCIGHLFYFC